MFSRNGRRIIRIIMAAIVFLGAGTTQVPDYIPHEYVNYVQQTCAWLVAFFTAVINPFLDLGATDAKGDNTMRKEPVFTKLQSSPFIGLALIGLLLLFIGGCNSAKPSFDFSSSSKFLQSVHDRLAYDRAALDKLAPIVGRQIVSVGGNLVSLECSPARSVFDATATAAILKVGAVTGPGGAAAASLALGLLAANAEAAAKLCPAVESIVSVGNQVKAALPTQTITNEALPNSTTQSLP